MPSSLNSPTLSLASKDDESIIDKYKSFLSVSATHYMLLKVLNGGETEHNEVKINSTITTVILPFAIRLLKYSPGMKLLFSVVELKNLLLEEYACSCVYLIGFSASSPPAPGESQSADADSTQWDPLLDVTVMRRAIDVTLAQQLLSPPNALPASEFVSPHVPFSFSCEEHVHNIQQLVCSEYFLKNYEHTSLLSSHYFALFVVPD
jgi:hypothetical protein